jgi:hypothetical protein
VLPFRNLSEDPAQEYLAAGITDALIGRLSSIHELRVISYTSVMRFRNPQESVPEIAKALDVDVVLEGSVIQEGNRIRAYAHAGRRGDALRLLSELRQRRKAGYIPAAAFVNAYLGLGDKENAFYWLEQAYREQSNILQFAKSHPYFDPIRSDPRFADLLRRVELG